VSDSAQGMDNRLMGITCPAQPGKQTSFVYDGLNRRTAITSTPAGGSAVTTSYIWCGEPRRQGLCGEPRKPSTSA
jgi:YD repeat-containing protein